MKFLMHRQNINFGAFDRSLLLCVTFCSIIGAQTIPAANTTTTQYPEAGDDYNSTTIIPDSSEITTTNKVDQPTSNESEEEESGVDKLEYFEKTNPKLRVIEKDSEQFGGLQLPDGYNKEAIPLSHNSKKPFKVAIFINIRSINAIDIIHEKMTLDLDLYEFWADSRFHPNHHNLTQNKQEIGNTNFRNTTQSTKEKLDDDVVVVEVQKLHPDFLSKLWMPDILIENTVLVPHNDLTREPLVSFNTKTGFVKYSRLEVNSPCAMSFYYYPLDTQKCELSLRSYKHFSDQFDLSWVHRGVILGAVNNANYEIKVDSVTKEKRVTKTINLPNLLDKVHLSNIIWEDRNFDVLKLRLNFRRNISFHLAQTYIPSVSFIAITWLCFLLPPSLFASKVGVNMTVLLTLNTMFISARQHSPQVTYAKAIDFWMSGCCLFTFLSLLIFTSMSWLEHVKEREEKRKKEFDEEESKAAVLLAESGVGDGGSELLCKKDGSAQIFVSMQHHPKPSPKHVHKHGIKMMNQDKLKRLLWIRKRIKNHGLTFLWASFLLFNIIYWSWICTGSEYFSWEKDPKHNEEN